MPSTRFRFLLVALTPVASFCTWSAAAEQKSKPNVVVILADDEGFADVGYQGCKDIPTPHIDAFAKSGVRFTNGYVSCPLCSPTRAGLMTGRYQQRFGHEFNPGPGGYTAEFGLPLSQITIADRMKAAGYVTGHIGKWHLGNDPKFHPQRRGFDEEFGFPGGAHDYFKDLIPNNPIRRGTEPVEEPDYLTDALTREAVSFIDRHAKEPFFLYLPYNAVHSPLQATEMYLDRFKNIADKRRRTHAAMLSALDDGVGKVLDELHKKGLDEKTLVFYLSDNGGPTPSTTSSNLPLRGIKGQVWEGGIHIPFAVRWTGKIPADKVYEKPVISLDIFPTAVAVAGGSVPDDRPMDGVNLLPYVTGEKSDAPHQALFWRMGPQAAVRKGNWKLVRMGDKDKPKTELYNLASDLSETKDVATDHADLVKEMKGDLEKWESQLATPLWTPARQRPGAAAASRPAGRPGRLTAEQRAQLTPEQRAQRRQQRQQRQQQQQQGTESE